MKTCFLFPTEAEAEPFRKEAPAADVRIIGVGMAAAATAVAGLLRERTEGPLRVVLCGVAGSYDRLLKRGEVVQVLSERIAELPERYAAGYRATWHFDRLREVDGNTVNCLGAGRKRCTTGIENMEGAAVMALCAAAGIPCGEIRAVSNYVGEPFADWRFGEAVDNLTETLTQIYRTL